MIPALEVHDLTVSYDRKPVLWDINLTLPQGKVIGMIGPNGAGKSTLLKTIMGLVPPDSGHVKIWGKYLEQARREVSYVPQKDAVDWNFPTSVLDVVMMGCYAQLGLFNYPGEKEKNHALDCLRQVGIEDLAHRQIAQLSGGQQQRVFLARALAQEASLYLMDEPFAGVDAATEKVIITILRSMTMSGKTVLVVHHDLQSVPHYFDWTVLVNMHIVASGPTSSTFTSELIQETYGSKLTLLNQVGHLLQEQELAPRE